MKKFLVALLLLTVVVAISYYKVIRQGSEVNQAYNSGYSDGTSEFTSVSAKVDSLQQIVSETESAWADSFAVTDSLRLHELDSLTKLVEQQSESLKTLTMKSAGVDAPSSTETGEDSADARKQKQAQVLAFYKKQYEELPADLSPYERRVALTEIRKQTIRQFSISMDELDKIRNNNSLPY